jgi:hypothetical protein
MAFKATALSTSDAFGRLRSQAASTKGFLQTHRAMMVAPTCDAQAALEVIRHLGHVGGLMSSWASTPGLAAYARAQVDDPNYDVVAEFNAMLSAINSAKTTLINMFPKDGSGYILYQKIQANGSLENRTFTAVQLVGAVAEIDAVIATID